MSKQKELRNQAILKLNKILRQGHIPCRSFKPYNFDTTYLANCFIHAVYNLKDKQLKDFDIDEITELEKHIYRYNSHNKEAIQQSIFSVIQDSGLKIKRVEVGQKCKKNQWIVAFYISAVKSTLEPGAKTIYEDYHFMLKDKKSGKWSEKIGPLENIKTYNQPPLTIDQHYHIYQLQGYYLITNPYAKKGHNFEQEEEYEI